LRELGVGERAQLCSQSSSFLEMLEFDFHLSLINWPVFAEPLNQNKKCKNMRLRTFQLMTSEHYPIYLLVPKNFHFFIFIPQ
jgi:hypothetical protein